MSQLKICDFSGQIFKGFEVLQLSMSATTTQLLSSDEFYKLRYDTIPVKSASANVSFTPVTQNCQILSCDRVLLGVRCVILSVYRNNWNQYRMCRHLWLDLYIKSLSDCCSATKWKTKEGTKQDKIDTALLEWRQVSPPRRRYLKVDWLWHKSCMQQRNKPYSVGLYEVARGCL